MAKKLSEGAIQWLASGRRGVSSNTMFTVLTGIDAMRGWKKDHPYDPADFDRCLQLLAAAPELREQLPKMAKVSKCWKALVANWEEVESCHLEEVGLAWSKGKSAPKTYALIKSVLGNA